MGGVECGHGWSVGGSVVGLECGHGWSVWEVVWWGWSVVMVGVCERSVGGPNSVKTLNRHKDTHKAVSARNQHFAF